MTQEQIEGNKTYLVISHAPSPSGFAFKQMPEMKEPDQLNYLGFNGRTLFKRKVKEYRQHLGTLEIIDIAPEYKERWSLGSEVKEGEFGIKCAITPCHCKDAEKCEHPLAIDLWEDLMLEVSKMPAQQESNEWLTDLIDWTQGETGWYVEHYLTPKSHQQEQESELRDELSNAYDKYKDSSYVNFIDYLFEHYKIIKQS